MSNIFIKFGEGGGSRQVESQPLVDRLRTRDVLDYAQHSGLIGCILDLKIKRMGETLIPSTFPLSSYRVILHREVNC